MGSYYYHWFCRKFKDFITAAWWKFVQKLGKSNILSCIKVYMLYDRVMRNMQKRHKRIKQMNSFTNARLQRKLRKFAEKPISGSRVRVPSMSWVSSLGSWIPRLGSWILGPGSHLWDGSRVSGLGTHQRSGVSDLRICRFLDICWCAFNYHLWVLLNRATTSTQLHPPPSSSF